MSERSPLLAVHVVRKEFRGRLVLRDLSLVLRQGEIIALVGPSGCGKSTLLRIAMGLEREFSGEASLSGRPVRRPVRALGLMFQEPRLLPWLTVAENVALGADRDADASRRALALLREMGLEERAGSFPRELSGGMAQRVALARALFREPEVLLLDEPFSAVDALTRARLQQLLLDVCTNRGIAVLLVTHDVEEAAWLADRVLVLAGGTIRAEMPLSAPRPRDRADSGLLGFRRALLAELERAHAGDSANLNQTGTQQS